MADIPLDQLLPRTNTDKYGYNKRVAPPRGPCKFVQIRVNPCKSAAKNFYQFLDVVPFPGKVRDEIERLIFAGIIYL